MNINFHYYLVKALAIEAGLTEGGGTDPRIDIPDGG